MLTQRCLTILPRTIRSQGLSHSTFYVKPRHFSTSAPVFKKKPSSATEDLFEEGEAEDLFAISDESADTPNASTSGPSQAEKRTVDKESIAARRLETFNTFLSEIKPYTIRPPRGPAKQPPRHTLLLRFVSYADTPDQLHVTADTFIAWREAARPPVDSQTAELFLRKCIGNRVPQLALQVLLERPKYGVDLPNLAVARSLLHELVRDALRTLDHDPLPSPGTPCTSSNVDDAFALAALYPIFSLPPAQTDIVSLALLAPLLQTPRGCELFAEHFSNVDLSGAASETSKKMLNWVTRSKKNTLEGVKVEGYEVPEWVKVLPTA